MWPLIVFTGVVTSILEAQSLGGLVGVGLAAEKRGHVKEPRRRGDRTGQPPPTPPGGGAGTRCTLRGAATSFFVLLLPPPPLFFFLTRERAR